MLAVYSQCTECIKSLLYDFIMQYDDVMCLKWSSLYLFLVKYYEYFIPWKIDYHSSNINSAFWLKAMMYFPLPNAATPIAAQR